MGGEERGRGRVRLVCWGTVAGDCAEGYGSEQGSMGARGGGMGRGPGSFSILFNGVDTESKVLFRGGKGWGPWECACHGEGCGEKGKGRGVWAGALGVGYQQRYNKEGGGCGWEGFHMWAASLWVGLGKWKGGWGL